MKIIIAYNSKTGTSKKCVESLSKKLEDAYCVDLKDKTPDFADYDLVVIGGAIRMGAFTRPVRKTLKKCEAVLLQKKVIYFINCVYPENREKYYCENIPESLRKRMLGAFCFGGEMNLARLKGSDYMVAATVMRQRQGSGASFPEIDERAIEQCANRIVAMEKNFE